MSLRLRFFLAFFSLLLCVISRNEIEAKLAKFLRYDIECPFLSEEEFAARLAKGRCLPTTAMPTTSTTQAPFSKLKKGNTLSTGAKKLLLKFVFLGKKRSVTLDLNEHVDEYQLVEGVFLEMKCPGVCKKNRDNVTWYFNGEQIQDSFLNWRVQVDIKGALHLSPVLVHSDEGRFECFLYDEWKGSVRLRVDTIMDAILAGYVNFLIGSAFSFLFLMCFFVLSFVWPAVGMGQQGEKKFSYISLFKDSVAAEDELDFQEWLLFQVLENDNKEVRVEVETPLKTPSIAISVEEYDTQNKSKTRTR